MTTLQQLETERRKYERGLVEAREVANGVDARRAAVALSAKRGDAKALAALSKVAADETRAATEIRDFEAALAALRGEFSAMMEAARATDLEARQQRARELAGELVGLGGEVDRAIGELADLLRRRADLTASILALRVLSEVGAIYLNVENDLERNLIVRLGLTARVRGIWGAPKMSFCKSEELRVRQAVPFLRAPIGKAAA